ncbi:MAG: hypothetical protein RL885_31150 [Planctomycetota bacterium]
MVSVCRKVFLGASLLVSFTASVIAQIDPEPVCTANVRADFDTPIQLVSHVIGTTGPNYSAEDMLVPAAVPLGILATDRDRVFLECFDTCTERFFDGPWSVTWALSHPSLGDFVLADGSSAESIFDADHVVFLPARDLECGEVRTGQVIATLFDPCSFVPDNDTVVEFEVAISRIQEAEGSYFSVAIVPGSVAPGEASNEDCGESGPGCCVLASEDVDSNTPIFAELPEDQFPVDGMLVGDLRPLNVTGFDRDLVGLECGEYPCPSTFADGGMCDFVEYRWEILSGPGAFLYSVNGISTQKTALYQASQPGEVTFRVTVDDPCTAFCGNDTEVEIIRSFYVYDLRFIDGQNTILPPVGVAPSPTLDEGLRVSRLTIGQDMNGCGGSQPTFDGPLSTDLDTYRLEIESPNGALGLDYLVQVRANRAFDDLLYDAEAYDVTYRVGLQGNLFRTLPHLRLVSNARPRGQQNLPAQALYDDEVCGDQSILVKLGDWISATLLIFDGQSLRRVGQIELPVGRPWSEPTAPQSILEGMVDWNVFLANFDGLDTGHADWAAAADFEIERASEDWAQAGIRFERTGLTLETQPFNNVLFMKDGGSPHLAGTLTLHVTPDGGSQVTVLVPVAVNDTRLGIVRNIRDAIEALLGDVADIHGYQAGGDLGWTLIVERGAHAQVDIASYGGTQLDAELLSASQDYGDILLTEMEANVCGLNLKDVLGLPQGLDVVIVPRWGIFDLTSVAKTGTSELGGTPLTHGPGLYYVSILSESAGNGWDGSFPMTLGHELGHLLLDQGDSAHVLDTENLMHASPVAFEDPGARKRLTVAQVLQARQSALLQRACGIIPEKQD